MKLVHSHSHSHSQDSGIELISCKPVAMEKVDQSIKDLKNYKMFNTICIKYGVKSSNILYKNSLEAMKHRNAKLLKLEDVYFAAKFFKSL